MKRFIRIVIDLLKWLGGLLLLFIFLINLSIVIYIEFAGNWLTEEDQKLKLIEEINDTEELPALFYEVNKQYFPEGYNKKFWLCFFKHYFLNKLCMPESVIAARMNYLYLRKERSSKNFILYKRFDTQAISRVIERSASHKQCYNYRMRYAEYGDNTRNIDQAARAYFNKTIDELNEREVIGLHIIHNAPTTYNPRLNPESHKERVESLIEKY